MADITKCPSFHQFPQFLRGGFLWNTIDFDHGSWDCRCSCIHFWHTKDYRNQQGWKHHWSGIAVGIKIELTHHKNTWELLRYLFSGSLWIDVPVGSTHQPRWKHRTTPVFSSPSAWLQANGPEQGAKRDIICDIFKRCSRWYTMDIWWWCIIWDNLGDHISCAWNQEGAGNNLIK